MPKPSKYSFRSAQHLQKFSSHLNQEYQYNQTKETEQNWIFAQYLALIQHHVPDPDFPVRVQDNSQTHLPVDYLIRLAGSYTLGVEVTEATVPQFRQELAAQSGKGRGYATENTGSDSILKSEIKSELLKSGETPETQAISLLHRALVNKTCKLGQYRRKFPCQEYHLAILLNPPLLNYDHRLVQGYLRDQIRFWGFDDLFEKVFLIATGTDTGFTCFLKKSVFTYECTDLSCLKIR